MQKSSTKYLPTASNSTVKGLYIMNKWDLSQGCKASSISTNPSVELREHFAQLGYVIQCTVPFHKEIDFPRGTAWIQCPSGELPTALQQENHVINGVKLHVQAQNAKALQEDQTSDKEKDFETSMAYESRQNGEFPV
uniref:RRM domain-containing protein n=1 Tax=Sus scrofa TaxID=9823 RepID=A0A4X1TDN3_PIG